MTERSLRIAIIGGGLSGAAMLLALLRRGSAAPLSVTVFEPRGIIGAGLAYGEAAPWHLLNVPARRASLVGDDPDHWWIWARQNAARLGWPDCVDAGPDSYLPRRLFGQYVTDLVAGTIRQQPERIRVSLSRSPVHTILSNREGGYALLTGDGRFHDADQVVLASGAVSTPTQLPGLELLDRDRCVDDPWDLHRLDQIRKDVAILIIGSALTMADTVLSLRRLGHKGRIDVLSRHGIVPQARRDGPAAPPCLTPDMARQGLSHLLHHLRHTVRTHGEDHWQAVFEGLRPVTQAIWLNLPPESRRRFARHLRTYWDAHRFRMPPATAAELSWLESQGLLRFHAGSLSAVRPGNTGIEIEYRERPGGRRNALLVQTVINCTGPRGSREGSESALIASLRRGGLLRGDVAGMGWDATPLGNLIDATGQVQPRLYTLGPPLRSTLLECTAISEIRQQAELQAKTILRGSRRAVRALARHEVRPEWA